MQLASSFTSFFIFFNSIVFISFCFVIRLCNHIHVFLKFLYILPSAEI